MNRVELIGNVTKDIDLRTTSSGKSIVSFTLAVDRRRKEDGTDFIDCVAFDKRAEVIARNVFKGHKLGVCGRISVRSYEDKNGNTRYATEVFVDEVFFLTAKKAEADTKAQDDLPL